MQTASAACGLPEPTANEVHGIVGLGLIEAVQLLFPGIEEAEADRVVDQYRAAYLGMDHSSTKLYPGTLETLQALRSAGHMLTVATGKSRSGLDRVLDVLNMGDFFDGSRCNDEAGSKPLPDMVLQLMQELAAVPAQTLVIGDSVHDLGMANAAGVAGIAVSYGASSVAQLTSYQPLAVIDSLDRLHAIVPGPPIALWD